MRTILQFVYLALLCGACQARAQVNNPNDLIAPRPKPPTQRGRPGPTGDLQWIWQYTKPAPIGRADNLRVDARFQALLATDFTQPQSMWGQASVTRLPLATVIPLFLSRYGTVTAEDNRYVSVDGCVPSFCPAAGLLWVDLGSTHPLIVFVAVNWNSENQTTDQVLATYSLWLFANHTISPDNIPTALTRDIAHWNVRLAAAHRLVPHIARALLVEPDGSPFAIDPQLAGANVLPPQPDTATPPVADND